MTTFYASKARKWVLVGTSLAMLVPILAACSDGGSNDPNNRRTLRIGTMYGSSSDESYFRQQYTDLFEFANSNIDIEIVPAIDYTESQFNTAEENQNNNNDPIKKVKELMTGANPIDVMILDSGVLGSLIQDNLLMPLDAKMKEDKIDPNDYVPAVIDGIKAQGDDQLYALAPTYTPSALFYNKKIFSKMNVSPPQENITWDQLFNLARQLKSGEGKDATFGFSFNQWGYSDPYNDMINYAAPLQLKLFDSNAEKMTVNTPQWENVWTTISQLYKDHILPTTEDLQIDYNNVDNTRYNPFQQQTFFNGKSAMVIANYSFINDIDSYNKNYQKFEGMEALDWDVVQVPTFSEAPGVSSYIYMSSLAGINAKAPNPDDAWKFVKFMNGKDWGKLKSRSSYEMPALKEFIKVKDGMSYNIDAFTTTKPILNSNTYAEQQLYTERPNLYQIQSLAQTEFNKVIQNEMTVKEALAEFETKGNDLLQKIKLNPSGPMEGVGGDVYGGGGAIEIKPMID
ncbi:ABC transporter substrate-binding protein [Cohnella fermenti]|uniref:Extracellular solute-binding protein n=1 Tax=Cohnella fermenti TaxID=2565925 RepID=A0A4S4BJI1_9BACL|nr:extracellular solute-binding protein [Cohnella fermenti]THF73853.1 extracellular solute-binding protein [Cohnella fermenti]